MTVLSVDISSGGISVSIFNAQAEPTTRAESTWQFKSHHAGEATLSAETILERFKSAINEVKTAEPPEAIGIGCFMHNCVLLDSDDRPLTPVFTWLDQRGEDGVDYVRSKIGARFHDLTGCRYHPMFPVFKLAALCLRDRRLIDEAKRVVSVKAFLIHRLTDVWIEDHGMASASGLYNLQSSRWEPELLAMVGLHSSQVPPISNPVDVAGHVTRKAAAEFGLTEGTTVINGSGDGFVTSVGSDCEVSSRISVTLGTSAAVRQALPNPILDQSSGTFCYKAEEDQFLVGCASNNGGNVLDWGRSIFGSLTTSTVFDPPIFIPLLFGERSPEWDPFRMGAFHELKGHHAAAEIGRSVLEGVIFNLRWLTEILENTSGVRASEIVLSGNGFLDGSAPRLLASITNVPVLMPDDPGMASLRGAAVQSLRALRRVVPPLRTKKISPFDDYQIAARYQRYKELRRQI